MSSQWPLSEPDTIARFKALAAAVRGADVTEGTIDVPFERVWAVVADLEGSFGTFEPDMQCLRILSHEGDHIEALAVSKYGMRARLKGTLRPGWCWLQSRFLIVGIAAAADGPDRTRVALTGGVRLPGCAALVPIGVKSAGHRSLRDLARQTSLP